MAGAAGFFHLLAPIPEQIAQVHSQFADVRLMIARLGTGGPGTAFGARLAPRVEAAYREFVSSLTVLAAQVARSAEEATRTKYDASRVRPDTGQSPHLRDLLHALPVKTTLATGAVGIGDVEELDKAPYWKAQEFGLDSGFVGRTLTGYFFGAGGSGPGYAPDPAMSRQHPIFRPVPVGLAPHMTISNPIVAGHFLTDASEEATAEWLNQYNRIEARAITQLKQVGAVIQAEIDALAAAEKL